MKLLRNAFVALIIALTAVVAQAGLLDRISAEEANQGIHQALTVGVDFAVTSLGREDGFLGNSRVRIPLPESLAKMEKAIRMVGMGDQADELIAAMNHAAEAAVAESRPILVDSIKRMSITDAKGILTGGDDSVTRYFARTASLPLKQKFLPIIKAATSRVRVAEQYNRFAGAAIELGLADREASDLDGYIAQKALDGLFLMIAERESAIRAHPLEAGSELLSRIFGAK